MGSESESDAKIFDQTEVTFACRVIFKGGSEMFTKSTSWDKISAFILKSHQSRFDIVKIEIENIIVKESEPSK